MYSLIKLLRNIGLSEKEAVTYCVTLKVGSNPASVIAKHAELNRGTTYTILATLIEKGLISQFEKDKIKYFAAIEPNQLITYINEKNRDLIHYKNEITDFLPEFEALRHQARILPRLKSYTGKVGITKIFNEALKEDKIYIWAVPTVKSNSFFTQFAPTLLAQGKEISVILHSHSNQKIHIKSLQDLRKLPPCIPVEFIGKQKILLSSSQEAYGIEILNPAIVKTFQDQFTAVWNK
jgi:sugar-specific transcriptional regulator TrmB